MVKLSWNETSAVLTQIVDTVYGTYDLKYDDRSLLTNITFAGWGIHFKYDQASRLTNKFVVGPVKYQAVNSSWQFAYHSEGSSSNLLKHIIDPRGNTNIVVQYDKYGRMTNQVDALSRTNSTEYLTATRQTRRTDAEGNKWLEKFDRKGHILEQADPLGNKTGYTYDDQGNRITITEPLDGITTFGYDNRANIISRTNALREVTRWEFHAFFNKPVAQITPQPADVNGFLTWTNFYQYDQAGNLTNHYDLIGSLVQYSYTTNGLVRTVIDGNGNISTNAYNTNGFLVGVTVPDRNEPGFATTSFGVNELGWRTNEVNAIGEMTQWAYDLNGNVIKTTDQRIRQIVKEFDPNGNLVVATDNKGQTNRFLYDAANQKTNVVDRAGNVWGYTYTPRGKLEKTIAPAPFKYETKNFYDAANRLTNTVYPLLNNALLSSRIQYDANSNVRSIIDKAGQRWTKEYDALNRAIREIDPLGNAKGTSYDVAGRIKQTTTPKSFATVHYYDGRGRLRLWKDPETHEWEYDYDGNANITNITDALKGQYVMSYGPRNERLSEKNQDNQVWEYSYDPLLRLSTQIDPNKTIRNVAFDDGANRIKAVEFTVSGVQTRRDEYEYDFNDNPLAVRRRVGATITRTQLFYDVLDRLTSSVDAFGKTVSYQYDALGQRTTVVYPGNLVLVNAFDAHGHLTKQTDWLGNITTYEYDAADRLIRREYQNGVLQTNTYDIAGRLTGLSYFKPGGAPSRIDIALNYAYDRNGNKIGATERGTLEWTPPPLAAETSTFTPAGKLLNRSSTTGENNQSVLGGIPSSAWSYKYDSSGNMTNATSADKTYTLTYDEDNRTTSIKWASSAGQTNIINRYDVLGRRIAREVNEVRTQYVLDVSSKMERILCDTDSAGTVTAYYIHGPDLVYKIQADGQTLAYHSDGQANVIAITSGNFRTASNLLPTTVPVPVAYWKLDEAGGNADDSYGDNPLEPV